MQSLPTLTAANILTALEKLDLCIQLYPNKGRYRRLQLQLFQQMGAIEPSHMYFIKTANAVVPDYSGAGICKNLSIMQTSASGKMPLAP